MFQITDQIIFLISDKFYELILKLLNSIGIFFGKNFGTKFKILTGLIYKKFNDNNNKI